MQHGRPGRRSRGGSVTDWVLATENTNGLGREAGEGSWRVRKVHEWDCVLTIHCLLWAGVAPWAGRFWRSPWRPRFWRFSSGVQPPVDREENASTVYVRAVDLCPIPMHSREDERRGSLVRADDLAALSQWQKVAKYVDSHWTRPGRPRGVAVHAERWRRGGRESERRVFRALEQLFCLGLRTCRSLGCWRGVPDSLQWEGRQRDRDVCGKIGKITAEPSAER